MVSRREFALGLPAALASLRRGYGAALMGGIAAARGRFVIMGDADDSYDFSALQGFVAALRDRVVDLGDHDVEIDCHVRIRVAHPVTLTFTGSATVPVVFSGFMTSNQCRCSLQSYTMPSSWLWMPSVIGYVPSSRGTYCYAEPGRW